jgi:predicted ATP-grasp superfamily ATP-dependent carboligase
MIAVGQEMRHGRLSPGKFLWSLRHPIEHAIFAADDPLPALVEMPLLARGIWTRRRG